jgi:hypothetical protein
LCIHQDDEENFVFALGEKKVGKNAPWILNDVEPGSPERKAALAWYTGWKAEQDKAEDVFSG